jgi:hypothetical protein
MGIIKMRMKYIIVQIEGKSVPVIFGEAISHKAVYRGVQQGLRDQVRESRSGGSWGLELVSAGFVEGLTAVGVSGESESLRYGFDHIPKELHDLTKSHPATDLPIINGGRSQAQIANDEVSRQARLEAEVRLYIEQILKKQAPEARHKSPPHRWDAAIKYATDKGFTDEAAREMVVSVATTRCPGAYKIP